MGVKVATSCFHWSQPAVPHSPSSPQTLASTVSSPSLRRRSFSDGALVFRHVQGLDRSALFGTNLYRSRSSEKQSKRREIRRVCSASLDAFSDEEFSKQIQDLAMRFRLTDDGEENLNQSVELETGMESIDCLNAALTHPRPFDPIEPPDWPGNEGMIPASVEWRANSVDLPVSLRLIKRKKQWQEGLREVGESACSSVNKAFSSMVFIIQELQSFSLQMREKLLYEDLQGILVRVQQEMQASFVWLFQQIFSQTPTLMVYVMILLANYSVHSMAAAAVPPPHHYASTTESVSVIADRTHKQEKFDSRANKTFSVSSGGRTASIGGNIGGGGNIRRVASGTEGDGLFNGSDLVYHRSSVGEPTTAREEESVSGQFERDEELRLWKAVVSEAKEMTEKLRDESLDEETVMRFVSPVTAKIQADDYEVYFRTELLYQTGLSQDPNNPLLLANFAQFLYLVAHDYDRAENYFKKATKVQPADAEAFNKYASFLWQAKKDLWAAEETYLEAISADPTNSYYAANYAHFLWNTGGEDTCFPVDNETTNEA